MLCFEQLSLLKKWKIKIFGEISRIFELLWTTQVLNPQHQWQSKITRIKSHNVDRSPHREPYPQFARRHLIFPEARTTHRLPNSAKKFGGREPLYHKRKNQSSGASYNHARPCSLDETMDGIGPSYGAVTGNDEGIMCAFCALL